jgi:hypothetical protein
VARVRLLRSAAPVRRGVVSPIDAHRLISGKGVSVIAKKKKAAKKKGKKKAKR